MAISDFYPFKPNQKVTNEQWNELFTAIQNGTFFLDVEPIAKQLNSISTRVEALEIRMDNVEQTLAYQRKREQFVTEIHQQFVDLEDVPRLDSEMVFLNGQAMSKSGIPYGFVGDYSIDGRRITFNPAWHPQILAGDVIVVEYEFEV